MKVFTNLNLYDPFTNSIIEGVSFSVVSSENPTDNGRVQDIFFPGDKIEFAGEYETIDLGGKTVVPGLIDAHVHVESTLLCPSHTTFLAQHGTVACIADPHEITNVLGEDGFDFFVEDSKNAVVDFRFTIPSSVPATDFETSGGRVTGDVVERIIEKDEKYARELQSKSQYATNCHKVIGLGEAMNVPGVLNKDFKLTQDILRACRTTETHMDGHSPGLLGAGLNRYISAGIATDHECTNEAELRARIVRGMRVLIREGTACHNAEALCTALAKLPRDATQRCCFCTDDRRIDDILKDGHIDNAVRIAIKCGINKFDALRMATLNTAEEFKIPDYGAIAPGRIASFIVVDGPIETLKISEVYVRGTIVPQNPVEKDIDTKGRVINKMNVDINAVKEKLDAAVFKGPAIGVIPNQIVTTAVEDVKDSMMMCVVDRYSGTNEMGTCLITNISLKEDTAVATTVAHDSHNIVCAGTSKRAMVAAIAKLVEVGGGYCVASGDALDVLPLPIAGLMTDRRKEDLLAGLHHFHESLLAAGAGADYDLMMTLSFMALPVIPKLKLTNKGLFDAEIFQFVH